MTVVVYKEQILCKSKLSESIKSDRKRRVIMVQNTSVLEIILTFIFLFMG